MSQRSLAAQRFWRDLIASCTRAGEGDLDTDDMAFVAFELALGLLALDASREELFAYLNVLRIDLEANSLAAVNAALRVHGESRVCEKRLWSWAGALSRYGDAHPRWIERQLTQLTELRCFTPSQRFDPRT
jgi:hypothetical protein